MALHSSSSGGVDGSFTSSYFLWLPLKSIVNLSLVHFLKVAQFFAEGELFGAEHGSLLLLDDHLLAIAMYGSEKVQLKAVSLFRTLKNEIHKVWPDTRCD